MIRCGFAVAACAVALAAVPASAEITSSDDTGFTVEFHLEIAASPARIWETVTLPGAWWSGEHTYSGNSANMTLEPRAGGCWCERTRDDGSVEHMRVIYAQPVSMLRLVGGLGPLQAMPVTGVLTYTITPGEGEDAATALVIRYSVSGAAGGLLDAAPLVDRVLAAQWDRLKEAAEAP